MAYLSDTFYLTCAGAYSDPINSNARLPLVYGDLTDGISGNWELPCLNQTDWVYAFAGHEVLSIANGNTIVVYENDLVLTGGGVDYTFNAANNYEGLGVIATIDMVNPKLNAIITATGKGKPTAAGGATLMENIIDIVNDFLTVENTFASSLFEATYKSRASQTFTAQAYEAAGAIVSDGVIWDIIIKMMASFLGSAYLNGAGNLVLEIDDGTISQYMNTIIRKSETNLVDVKQRLVNIVNQCPANYSYNYAVGEFRKETNDSAHADAISQSIYGVREPNTPYQFYWCRDLTSVQKIQDIIVAKLKTPIYEIEIENITLNNIHLDQGDVFIHSVDSLYDSDGLQLLNQYWRIVSVEPKFSKAKINFRALQTNYFLAIAYLADSSHLADGSIKAGGDRDPIIY